MKQQPSIAKITRPKLAAIFPRKRLFKILDGGRAKPITWVSAPAGSGKTTLVASWLDARKLPCLWYQIDEGDGDIASFFYYMGLAAKKAAPRYRTPLPLLTPEYLMGLSTFTKRYFENLFSRMTPPFALVFDNYQDAPIDTGLQEIVRAGFSTIPDGIRVIVISRSEPPPALARLRASDTMGAIEWNEIRFTLEETRTLVRNREQKRLPDAAVKELHDTTDGWAAGLVLMMSREENAPNGPHATGAFPLDNVFGYFAGEVLDKLDSETRDFLLIASFLPRMTSHAAAKLTDNDRAGRILSGLCRDHFFTEQHSAVEAVYQFHPLFRNFLLSRAKEALSREGVLRIQKRAATLLVEADQIEDAIGLFLETGDWGTVIGLILGHAQTFMMQGRSKTLEGWLNALPRELIDATPWLLYWLGVCRMPFDPAKSRGHFDKAFQLFEQCGDIVGTLLSASTAIDAVIIEWSDFTQLDRWIGILDSHITSGMKHLPPEIEARVTLSMAFALMICRPESPDMDDWISRMLSLFRQGPDANLRIQAYILATLYFFWIGDQGRGRIVLEEIRGLGDSPGAAPLQKLIWLFTKASQDIWDAASPGPALTRRASEALAYAKATGVHIWDHMLYAVGIYGAIALGDLAGADTFLSGMKPMADGSRRHVECHFHYLCASRYHLEGKATQALAHAETSLKLADETGYVFPIILCLFETAQILNQQGRSQDAEKHIERAYKMALETRSMIFQFMCLMTKAQIVFSRGKEQSGLTHLRSALRIGREREYFNLLWWYQPSEMAKLCAKALEAGIEPEYTQKMITIHKLLPGENTALDYWPWPVKIYTLGRFELEVEGKTLLVSRTQQKPLLMLKALIAFGGEEISEDRLTDALWPEAEGDQGRRSFDTTLHRLRKFFGNENAVRIQSGRLTLNPGYLWTDIRSFEQLISDAGSLWSASAERKDEKKMLEAIRLYEKAAALYKGHFLPNDTREAWTTPSRERARTRFITVVTRLSGHYQAGKNFEKAIEFLQEGLAVEGLSEELYQGLMTCYKQTGREPEAAAVYHRCRKMLSETLGVGPSTKTEVLYSSLRLTDRSS